MPRNTLNMVIYPSGQALITGHVADFFKTIRNVKWRIEVYDGQPPKWFKDDKPVSWEQCPLIIKNYSNSAIDWLSAVRKVRPQL